MKLASTFVAIGTLVLVSCGGGSKRPATPQCQLPSDCTDPLICVQGYCVKACAESRDCPSGERCIKTGDPERGVPDGTLCQPFEKAACHFKSDCTTPLVCAIDLQCRNECQADEDCPGGVNGARKCTAITKLCVDPDSDKDYDPAANELKSYLDGGMSGGGGASGAGGMAGAGGAAGSGAIAGAGGGAGTAGKGGGGAGATGGASGRGGAGGMSTCPTQFGTIVMGDANPLFSSGVGVRSGDKVYVFYGYYDTGVDGGTALNAVYVQAFSVATTASLGAPVKLFDVPPGLYFFVFDVSVAPTGEMALLYGSGTPGDGFQTLLYAAFLTTTDAGDGGVAGVRVQRTVQLESVHLGEPHVTWSVAAGAFVTSWKYATTNWFIRVKKFLPDGRLAGGDTNVVPTPTGYNNDQGWDDGQVGTSGGLFGVAYRNYSTGDPYLTLLDGDGTQVGELIKISTTNVSHWVSVGGTSNGFVVLFNSSSTVNAVFVPTTGAGSVVSDGGVPDGGADGGDAGSAGPSFGTFSMPSTASTAHMSSDDTGGANGVGAVLLESNGASFLYVTADGSKRMSTGTVISSASGSQVTLTNYHGSFALSLYDSAKHQTQVAISGCQ